MTENAKVLDGKLRKENTELRARLEEAEQALDAIRHGDIDAIVVNGEQEEQVYILQGADHFYRVLVETMNEGTATLSSDGLILYANSRLATLLKMNLEEILGTNFIHFVRSDQRPIFDMLLERSQLGNARGEITLRCTDNTNVPVLLSLSFLANQEMVNFCLVATDLTEQKETEEYLQERTNELSNANEELEIAKESLNTKNEELEVALKNEKSMRSRLIQTEKYAALARLVASVAHEINNPLQTVQNSLFILQQEIPAGEAQTIFKMAISETKRLGSLVQQLKETYKPSNYQAVEFNLIEILGKVSNLTAPQLKQNNIEWLANFCANSVLLHGVPDQLQQVFLNISINAIDAMGSKGGQLRVDVSVIEEGQKVCVTFQDTGPGIPEKNLGRIFEPFFTTKSKGTGLGLSICYEIVRDHKGEITVESHLGQGTTFRVLLPLKTEIKYKNSKNNV